jgi:hypothetical protein
VKSLSKQAILLVEHDFNGDILGLTERFLKGKLTPSKNYLATIKKCCDNIVLLKELDGVFTGLLNNI